MTLNEPVGSAGQEQEARVFITYYRDATRYSLEELERAQQRGVGGDVLYRAMQQPSADPLVEKICSPGATAVAHEMDLSVPENIPHLFDLCETELGPVDVLVNNHTYCVLETFDPELVTVEVGGGIRLISPGLSDAHFAVNARAYALMMAEYLKRYLGIRADANADGQAAAKWGGIINLSTDAAHANLGNVYS